MHLLTHSRMTAMKTCARKHYLAYELGIRRDTDSQPLRMGSAVHVGVDVFYASGLQAAVDAIRQNYATLPGYIRDEKDVTDWLVECETCVRLVCGYAWRWSESQTPVISSEQHFLIPLDGLPDGWALAGKIDREHDEQTIGELKTTSDSIDGIECDYWDRLRIDQQISQYVIAARESRPETNQVLYDVIRKPAISPKNPLHGLNAEQKAMLADGWYYNEQFTQEEICAAVGAKKESARMYGARLNADISERPDFYYQRRTVPRLEADLDEFRREACQLAAMIDWCREHDAWPRNTNACVHPYKCEYRSICFNNIDPLGELPAGYIRAENVHPELSVEALRDAAARLKQETSNGHSTSTACAC